MFYDVREFESHRFRQQNMSVEFTYTTLMQDSSSRLKRNIWLYKRIPSEEYFVNTDTSGVELDLDDIVKTTVTIWHEDAERIATEFWFQFP